MSSEKPNFLSQPVVKNVFMFRNGDPYFEARRIVINEKRVCNFETLLREVTGGIQAPFGAVRNIYTPRGGHRVEGLESLQSGEQYVAAGKERFKKLDYLDIGTRKKRRMHALPLQAKPLPPNRIAVSARFLKPIREPCTIFVVANGDTLNPAVRLLIHQRMMGQFDKILELITEKLGLRVLGGVRSLYSYEGHQVTDGNKLECGQLYVAAGRERFKKLPYSDILFTRLKGTRRIKGMKAYSLPPIYRFSKQSGNSKSPVRSSDSGDRGSKDSPPNHSGSGSSSKEHLSSAVREISQARLLSLRTRKSGQSITAGTSDNDVPEPKADDGNTNSEPSQDQKAEEKSDTDGELKATTENDEKTEVKVETSKICAEEDISASKEDKKENQETDVAKEGEETKEAEERNDEKERGATAENEQDVKKEVKVEVTEESKDEVKSEEQESNGSSDKTQGNKEKEDEPNTSTEAEKEQDSNKDEDKQEEDSGNREESSSGNVNDVESGEERKETEKSNSPKKTQSDDEKKESGDGESSNSNQQEDVIKTKEEAAKEPERAAEEESKADGEVRGDSDEVDSRAEPENKNSDSRDDGTVNTEKVDADKEDTSRKEKDS
ncbi:doublecortin domain-containing protein 2 [Kryptolebias marmoratus]|uniref:Doublecortin domain-containing protein 2 n=1 Tax=Kryptolebias marmoratus TaxID=37003 RepID=A0A3Q3BA36_KRYMA|nr:doublecortin domain-containing protein 2 [Kryptolebias marmoratus]